MDLNQTPGVYRIVRPSPVILPADWAGERRHPPRPPAFRQKSYLEKFDPVTLWYDFFPDVSGKVLMGIGPPLLNLKDWISTGCLTSAAGNALSYQIWDMDRCGCLMADLEDSRITPEYILRPGTPGKETTFVLRPEPNHCEWFRNRRVLLTKSRNNRLDWIRDWASWHVRRHGADAVLFYDNQSSDYTEEVILEMLAGIPGVAAAVVVPWDFRFGPTGMLGHRWDSDFCQHGLLENARWRFLAQAASVLCCDVDELVVTPKGRSIFQICEESATGGVVFDGRWVGCIRVPFDAGDQGADSSVLHRDHRHFLMDSPPCPDKWAIVPSRITEDSQWNVHAVDGHRLDRAPVGVGYRHCKGISTSWKYFRESARPFDPEIHEFDAVLAKAWEEEFKPPIVPWMSPEEIALMELLLKPGDKVLEFGAGQSSLWLAARAAHVYSIEHDRTWIKRLQQRAPANLHLHLAEPEFPHSGYQPAAEGQFAGYLSIPGKLGLKFDFCLVDGRARIASAVKAAQWIREGGWLLIHDWYHRERYTSRLGELLPYYEFCEDISLRETAQTMAVFRKRLSDIDT